MINLSSTHNTSIALQETFQICTYYEKYDVCFFSLTGDKNSILELREEHDVAYQRSFPGCQLIDWLLQNGEAESRRQGLELCRALQEHGIIQHGEGSPHLPFEVCCQSVTASNGWPDLK